MKNVIVFLVLVFGCTFLAIAQKDNDTVWTKDLWQLGTSIYQVEFTPDQQNIAVGLENGVFIFDIKNGNLVKKFNKYVGSFSYFVFTDDGSKLIIFSTDNKISIWDYEKEDTLKIFNDIFIYRIKLLDKNKLIGIGYNGSNIVWEPDSSRIYLFDLNTGEIITKVASRVVITALAISDEHNLLSFITAKSGIRFIQLWNVSTLNYVATIGFHDAEISDLTFSSDGKYLASADVNGEIKIWDLETKKLLKSLAHISMNDGYLHVKFSPNNGYLISSGGIFPEGFITKIWSLETFQPIYQYETLYTTTTSNIDISKDSTKIILGRSRLLFLLNSHWSTIGVVVPPNQPVQVIYPNPAGNEITIPFESGLIPQSVNITNSIGQIVKSIMQINQMSININIDISSFSPGIYFISVVYPTKTISYKFEKLV